jgi:hypothetical protein
VRALFKKEFAVNQDEDFALHDCVTAEIARAYDNGGDGPDENDLHLDMAGGINSTWNEDVRAILLAKLKDARREEGWSLPRRSDWYLTDLIKERFSRVVRVWQTCQRRTKKSGELESWDEVEQRVVAQKEAELLIKRHTTRRRNASGRLY